MVPLSRYWQFITLDATGHRRIERIPLAHAYLCEHFGQDSVDMDEISDSTIQQHLWQVMPGDGLSPLGSKQQPTEGHRSPHPAELALRCYISYQIDQACHRLGRQFGTQNGFTAQEMLPLVLDDSPRLGGTDYCTVGMQILQTFQPDRGSLKPWVQRHVKQHPEVKKFLLQHGVYLVSDWAILNDTTVQQVYRILGTVYPVSAAEQTQAAHLLESYHAVYRHDRIQQQLKVTGSRTPCQPPTPDQLLRIQAELTRRGVRPLPPATIFSHLCALAAQLRHHRIAVQGGIQPTQSLDDPNLPPMVDCDRTGFAQEQESEQAEFLQGYRQQFHHCLETAIAQVIPKMIAQRKRKSKSEAFVTALHLFHCRGLSMSEIAPKVGLKQQYEVTRLLNLKDLRDDIRHYLLLKLRDRVLEQAADYLDVDRLQRLDHQIDEILDDQVRDLIQSAESEAKQPMRNQPFQNRLAQQICQYLDSQILTAHKE